MAKKTISKFNEKEMDSIIDKDIILTGLLKFRSNLLIKGEFDGEIETENGHLFIDSEAKVKADIRAGTVSCKGEIIGNVEASKKFELFSGAVITGDIIAPDLNIEAGSVLNGNCTMVAES